MSDKPTIVLNFAARLRLAQLIAMPGLIAGGDQASFDQLASIGAFAEEHLNDLPSPPTPPSQGAPVAEWRSWEKDLETWGRTAVEPITVSVRRREALRAVVKAAAGKGVLSGALADRTLLKALELGWDD